MFNTLRPRQNGRHFADNFFKCICWNENVWISMKISPTKGLLWEMYWKFIKILLNISCTCLFVCFSAHCGGHEQPKLHCWRRHLLVPYTPGKHPVYKCDSHAESKRRTTTHAGLPLWLKIFWTWRVFGDDRLSSALCHVGGSCSCPQGIYPNFCTISGEWDVLQHYKLGLNNFIGLIALVNKKLHGGN